MSPQKSDREGSPYCVIVCDLFNPHDPDHETVIEGFPTQELAIKYARRRTWSSVEEMKESGLSREEVRRRWLAMGEDCRVVGPEGVLYVARAEMETFLTRSIPPEHCDWAGLYRSLLPEDFTLTYSWAAGSMPPPHHYEYTIAIQPDDRGRILFWPDYPAALDKGWEVPFSPDLTACILLYNQMQAANLFSRRQEIAAESATGGEWSDLKVVAAGAHVHLPLYLLHETERLALHRAICAIVPDSVWEDLHTRRQHYIKRAYPG